MGYTPVDGTTLVASADHANMHNVVGSAVGTTNGTNVLMNFSAGKFAVFNTGGTLDAGVLGTPMVRGGTIGTALIGTSSIIGGTIGTALVGTSTITGGTVNTVDIRGFYTTPQSTTLAAAGNGTLDINLSNEWRVTFGTGNGTLTVSNAVDGKKFLVSLTQDAVGTRTITWFTTIKWAGSAAPTLTATANKRDTFGFVATGTNTFDGIVVGQNI